MQNLKIYLIIKNNIKFLYIISIFIITFETKAASETDGLIIASESALIKSTYLSLLETFKDNSGTYNLLKMHECIVSEKFSIIKIPINKFSDLLFRDMESEEISDILPTFRSHIGESLQPLQYGLEDCEAPILVSADNKIIDSFPRIFRALASGVKTIDTVILDRSFMRKFLEEEPLQTDMGDIPVTPIQPLHIHIPKHRLSHEDSHRRDLIEGYFCEHLPTAIEHTDSWEIVLERPSSPYECYTCDKEIYEGLEWWNPGTRIRDIPFSYQYLNQGIFAIEDQWMPLSWARYFRRSNSIPEEIVLLHLDDHRDMMSPRIGVRLDDGLYDLITGDSLSLSDPNSVIRSIESGAIGKGSILTPLIWETKKVHVRHLCLREHPHTYYNLSSDLENDEILGNGKSRISLKFNPVSSKENLVGSSYVVSPNPILVMADIPEEIPILLHIDMDYFSNPFDGQSDWVEKGGRHEYSILQQKELIDQFINSLKRFRLADRIVDVAIGISPGFYPSSSWIHIIPYLFERLSFIGIDMSFDSPESKYSSKFITQFMVIKPINYEGIRVETTQAY